MSELNQLIGFLEEQLTVSEPTPDYTRHNQEIITYIEYLKLMKQAQLNENQHVVLDWLKANVEQDNASPMCAIFLLGEWQTRIGSKELRSVDISYCCLNSKQQAEVLNAFSQWSLEQEEE
ncbi:hypothetical protein ACS7ZM_001233 [Enterococcus faecalis]|nr:MAG TPA: hypothetical protein [Caudoviricetes sp.]